MLLFLASATSWVIYFPIIALFTIIITTCAQPSHTPLLTLPPPVPATTDTPTSTPSPQPILNATATRPAAGNYIIISLTYSIAQLSGIQTSLNIAYQDIEPTPILPVASPDGYYPPAILFKDESGNVLLKQPLLLVSYKGDLNVGEAMLAQWVSYVQNNDQYACVALELETGQLEATIEPPLRLCASNN